MRILFLHGWNSKPGGVKPTFLASHGHQVINPALPDDDFQAAVHIAQAEYDRHRPDVIVGSSRGGAVAINLDTADTPIVLLCPAWKRWGIARRVKKNTTILHSRADDVICFAHSQELLRNSGLAASALIEVGTDHRLADPEPLTAMLRACEQSCNE
jgi:alpha-beta hydrolase superfamily lysophospholipase